VEAKFHERYLLQAVAKVQNDYLKFYKILGIKGGFALLYPRELAKPMSVEQVRREAYRRKFRLITIFPPEDKRNFAVIEGHIGEIANLKLASFCRISISIRLCTFRRFKDFLRQIWPSSSYYLSSRLFAAS